MSKTQFYALTPYSDKRVLVKFLMFSHKGKLETFQVWIDKIPLGFEDKNVLQQITDLEALPKVVAGLPQLRGRLQGFLRHPDSRNLLGDDFDVLKRLLAGVPDRNLANTQEAVNQIGQAIWKARKKSGRKSLEEKVMQALPGTELLGNVMRFTDVFPDIQNNPQSVHDHFRDFFPTADKRYPWRMRVLIGLAHALNFFGGRKLVSWGATLATKKMARRFIAGADPQKASPYFRRMSQGGIGVIADILGEAIKSEKEAEGYMGQYQTLVNRLASDKKLILNIRKSQATRKLTVPIFDERHRLDSKISLKLSSLYSQWNVADPDGTATAVKERLRPILRNIQGAAKDGVKIGLAIDMEQFQYRDLTYKIFKEIFDEPEFCEMENVEIVVQAYLIDSLDVIDDLASWSHKRSHKHGRSVSIRLVKGAYWDQENIWSDQKGFSLPVFPEKWMSDANFERCIDLLLDNADSLRLTVASHNIRSISYAIQQSRHRNLPIAFQVLMGMDEAGVAGMIKEGLPVEMFMPIGKLLTGMAYLARRMLENASQDSFLRMLIDPQFNVETLLKDPSDSRIWPPLLPLRKIPTLNESYHREPLTDFSRQKEREKVVKSLKVLEWQELDDVLVTNDLLLQSRNPSSGKVLGVVNVIHPIHVFGMIERAKGEMVNWSRMSVSVRAAMMHRAAAFMRDQKTDLTALIMREAGKTLAEADGDVAEAIDFLEYYAREAIRMKSDNPDLDIEPKGVVAVISPWNFPLAILTGMACALVVGNAVIMKPSEETPLIAKALHEIFLKAGVPAGVVQLAQGDRRVGEALTSDDVDHIAFTGSKKVGLALYEKAAAKGISITAELGGINTHIVGEDTNPDDMITAVLNGKFGYGGQKCSAIQRVIFNNSSEERYIKNLERLIEAVGSLKVGPVDDFGVFYGPLIRKFDVQRINRLIEDAGKRAGNHILYDGRKHPGLDKYRDGNFAGPTVIEVVDPHDPLLQEEIFGPVLIVMRAKDLSEAVELAQSVSTGLTGGYQGRSPSDENKIIDAYTDIGNLYINRDESGTTGAVVGQNNFGGQKLSGIAGSKAGGGSYLWQFVNVTSRNPQKDPAVVAQEMTAWMQKRLDNPNHFEHLQSPMGVDNSIDYRPRGKGLVVVGFDTQPTTKKAMAAAAKVLHADILVRSISEDVDSLKQMAGRPDIGWISFLNCFDPDVAKAATQVQNNQHFIRPVVRINDAPAEREKIFQMMTEPRTLSVNYARHGQMSQSSIKQRTSLHQGKSLARFFGKRI